MLIPFARRTPREAVDAFLDPLKDVLSCIARAKLTLSHDGWDGTGKIHGLTSTATSR
jgi:hypothetical protein